MSTDPDRQAQRRLQLLLEEARRNEQTLRRFQQFELELMACPTLAALLHTLVDEGARMLDWERVRIHLMDTDYTLRQILHQSEAIESTLQVVVFHDAEHELVAAVADSRVPQLGPYEPGRHVPLLGQPPLARGSVALLPLRNPQRLCGLLAAASARPERFPVGAATDFMQHLAAVIAMCIDMTASRDQLRFLGLTDALTGVNNRRFFDQRLTEEIARVSRRAEPLSLLIIDIDHFKRVNDTLGHLAGDLVLRRVAPVIRAQLRSSDVVARYGGEEFTVLLPDTGERRADEIGERIRAAIAALATRTEGGTTIGITVSIGIATLAPLAARRDAATTGTELLSRADAALYRAKSAGRNRVLHAPG
ncbi:MAG: sensor domain-containing diguanylate cyclase [Gammaproteobacteria bacterium]|nr:sensor domain-containing diguanylate cyclase [Gammaproteobacteria bacterium]